ncbi:hydroxyethylthiazole kinase [Cognatishimia sp. MH4019]|uniref:hydroxyethylthiazole kinase n=1 Tax=Cognatishimia sp. MH4019 TaxID=2854030 RepID=UPI001CD6CD21|nr:hydroxyethylthiazole kinase [Cognatishimia sp. MH4019]
MNHPSQALNAMRSAAPLVQNITNYVAMNVMANVMLAAGASPAMAHARGEAAEFAGFASALSINIGTLDAEWIDCMVLAAKAASAKGTPWVLDPVAVGATGLRQEAGAQLLALNPTIIRGNASEIMALAGLAAQGRGADAADPVSAAEEAARDLATRSGAVVAVTGEVDFVTDGTQAQRIANGHAMMPLVTALGCSLTGIVAAFTAAAPAYDATVAALAYYGAAGEVAAQTAQGPGSFQVAFLDALHAITGDQLDAMARITPA